MSSSGLRQIEALRNNRSASQFTAPKWFWTLFSFARGSRSWWLMDARLGLRLVNVRRLAGLIESSARCAPVKGRLASFAIGRESW